MSDNQPMYSRTVTTKSGKPLKLFCMGDIRVSANRTFSQAYNILGAVSRNGHKPGTGWVVFPLAGKERVKVGNQDERSAQVNVAVRGHRVAVQEGVSADS